MPRSCPPGPPSGKYGDSPVEPGEFVGLILKGLDCTDAREGFLEPSRRRANTLDRLAQGRNGRPR